jgi:methane monooxygenase component C
LAKGEPVRVRGPHGQFIFRYDPKPVFIAGGTGVAPILAILRSLAQTAPDTEARVVLGVGAEADLFGVDELSALSRALPNLDVVITVEHPTSSWSGAVGRATDHLGAPGAAKSYYLCGPSGMVSAAEELLAAGGVPRDRIHIERFLETGGEQS